MFFFFKQIITKNSDWDSVSSYVSQSFLSKHRKLGDFSVWTSAFNVAYKDHIHTTIYFLLFFYISSENLSCFFPAGHVGHSGRQSTKERWTDAETVGLTGKTGKTDDFYKQCRSIFNIKVNKSFHRRLLRFIPLRISLTNI